MTNVPNHEKYSAASRHLDTVERLLLNSKAVPSGCREWQLARNRGGYGVISSQGVSMAAHRLSFWIFSGPIEGGLVVDHMCQNKRCINPKHLRLLTAAENSYIQPAASKTHCAQGHPLDGDNLYVYINPKNARPVRACKTCRRERTRNRGPEVRRRWRAKRRALGLPAI